MAQAGPPEHPDVCMSGPPGTAQAGCLPLGGTLVQAQPAVEARCSAKRKTDGKACTRDAGPGGLCMAHVPAAVASRTRAGKEAAATRMRRAQETSDPPNPPPVVPAPRKRVYPPGYTPTGRELAANARRHVGPTSRKRAALTALRKRAADAGIPLWQRWAAGRMVERDLTLTEFAPLGGFSLENVRYIFRRKNGAPRKATVKRFEAMLGDAPPEVRASIRQARSAAHINTKAVQQRLRKRTARWTRERLAREVAKILKDQPPSPKLRARIADLPYANELGSRAYGIYSAARMEAARHKGRASPPPRNITTPNGPKALLSKALYGLEKRTGDSLFFQCQSCLQIWQRRPHNKGLLCGPCERRFLVTFHGWRLRDGPKGPAPLRPKGQGRRLKPSDIQESISDLLGHKLGRWGAGSSSSIDYKALSETRKRLANSAHPWCLRITALLLDLD